MKKKVFGIILSICLLTGVVGGMTFFVDAEEEKAWDGSVDTSWYNTSDTEFTLMDAADLAGFAAITNGTTEDLFDNFEGKTIKLGADIVMNAGKASTWSDSEEGLKEFAMISNANYERYDQTKFFAGEFDGQGHTVSGVYVKSAEIGHGGVGFFSGIYGAAKIHDFALVNSCFYQPGNRFAGGIVASAWTKSNAQADAFKIYNIYTDAYITASGDKQGIGGIVGRISQIGSYTDAVSTNDYNEIYSCVFAGKVKQTGNCAAYTGGILGSLGDIGITITDCLNAGDVISASNGKYIGGIIGKADPNHCKVNLIRCVGAVAPQSVTHQIGGLLTFGSKDPYAETARGWKIEDCYYVGAKYGVNREGAEYEDPNGNTEATKLDSYDELKGLDVSSEICSSLRVGEPLGAKWTLRDNGIMVPTGTFVFNPADYNANDSQDGNEPTPSNPVLDSSKETEGGKTSSKKPVDSEVDVDKTVITEDVAETGKNGCRSVVLSGGIVVVAAVCASAVALRKKKED